MFAFGDGANLERKFPNLPRPHLEIMFAFLPRPRMGRCGGEGGGERGKMERLKGKDCGITVVKGKGDNKRSVVRLLCI